MAIPSKTRIMVFGTFDFLHPGHLHFFKQARKLARRPYLIVSVARDRNVKRIKKNQPLFSEKQRLGAVKRSPLVNLAILGGLRDHLPHIIKQRPSIIALGYDQRAYVKNLGALLLERGLKVKIVKLKAHKRHLHKSSLYKGKISTGLK